jgi:hypothetical protein
MDGRGRHRRTRPKRRLNGHMLMTRSFLCARAALVMLVTGVLVAPASANDFKTLDEGDLKAAVVGKTLRLNTKIGSIPISFRADGTMTGRTSDLVNYLGRGYDTGTWWVDGGKLCQKWKSWLDAQAYCFTLRQSGQTVHWTRSDGLKGTITVSSN